MKNLNKVVFFILTICLLTINNVQAGGKNDDKVAPDKLATCKYTAKSGVFDVSFEISLNVDGTVSRTPDSGGLLETVDKYAYYPKYFDEEFKKVIYQDGKVAKNCPTVYVCDGDQQFGVYPNGVSCAAGDSSKGVSGNLTYISSDAEQSTNEKTIYCTKRKTLRNSSSFDAKIEFFKDTDGKNKFSVYKVFKKDNSEVLMGTAEPSGIVMIESFSIRLDGNYDAYFSNKCSSASMYFRTTDGINLYAQNDKPDDVENGSYAVTETEKDSGKDLDEGKNKSSDSTKKDTDSSNNTGSNTECPLGADVTKDLYGALKIFKIAAPLLVIGFTIIEFVQALAKGDITAELKKLSKRLLKRCVFAVILFFLPVLVNQIMQLANVWDENGTCDFSDEIQYNASDNNNNNNNSQNTSRDTQTKKDDYRQKNCDGYYNATTDECVKKSNVTCSTFSGEKSKCKNLSKDYGLSCEYNETNFKCSESSTVIEPSNTNNSIISDVSKFPKESLNCWKYGYDNCSGVCKWTGENSATGACRSKSEISSNIVESVCSLATDRDSCTSIDSYCEWTGYKCAPYTE